MTPWFVSTLVLVLFAASSHGQVTVDITCDNVLKFYADGQVIVDQNTNGYDDWTVTNHVIVPADTKVYGIECVDHGVKAGILASFSDGTKTDETWRCTNTDPGASWLEEQFDDSQWLPAFTIIQNTGIVQPWGVQAEIDEQAKWIWTSGWSGADRKVWCRKYVDHSCRRSVVMWYNEGCIWDRADFCVPRNTITKCGWGTRRHHYYCGPNDVRDCTYKCYKPCANEVLPDCSPENTVGCNVVLQSACTSKCGVGNVIMQWSCPERRFTCKEDCCCDRCTGGKGGNQGFRPCNDENMALPMSDYAGLCPNHVLGPA